MTDKINEKIIDIFTKNKKNAKTAVCEEKVCTCEDGYYYVCMKSDLNGKHFDEAKLLNEANNCYYIVKVMIKQALHPYILNYKIPGTKILEFIKLYMSEDKEGQIIEIDKFYPEDWA